MSYRLADLEHQLSELAREHEGTERLAYQKCRSLVEKLMIDEGRYFGVVRWSDEDIAGALAEDGIEPTAEIICEVRCKLEHHSFTDLIIERGWECIHQTIGELDFEQYE